MPHTFKDLLGHAKKRFSRKDTAKVTRCCILRPAKTALGVGATYSEVAGRGRRGLRQNQAERRLRGGEVEGLCHGGRESLRRARLHGQREVGGADHCVPNPPPKKAFQNKSCHQCEHSASTPVNYTEDTIESRLSEVVRLL
eukprot:4605479-Pyramimonas_sp.AAC.2